MSYSIGQAAKATGRSKATIHRAIQGGKISAVRNEASGAMQIDPAELHRIFPPVSEQSKNGELRQSGTVAETADTAMLRALLEQERQERERERQDGTRERQQLERQIDDLTRRLDSVDEERRTTLRQLTALLTDQRKSAHETAETAPVKRRWRLWGRG